MIGLLLGAGAWLKAAFSSAFSAFARYPWQTACVALLCLSAFLWWRWDVAADDRDTARAQTAEIIKASEEAERLAIADREAREKRSKENADATDKEHKSALADATSAASRYISLHKVGKCSASQTTPASQDHGAEGSIGSSSEAVMVAVSEADIHICTENTTRLDAVRDWALSLNP